MQTKAAFSAFKNMSQKLTKIKPTIKTTSFEPLRPASACDIFINHRGIDTKRTISGLLYNHLSRLGYKPFLDSKNMKPGDKLFDRINPAIKESKIGVAVFSPRYCESLFCLHELSLIMETKKRVIPIFCDVKPSELRVVDDGRCSPDQFRQFSDALEEAKLTVGLTFDSHNGDWSEFLTTASFAIVRNMMELDGHTHISFKNHKYFVKNQY